jgi:hypothetical protein
MDRASFFMLLCQCAFSETIMLAEERPYKIEMFQYLLRLTRIEDMEEIIIRIMSTMETIRLDQT